MCRHWRKIFILSFYFYFPRYRPPFGENVCVLYLFFVSRYELCVCVGTCVRVCVCAQIWSRHQPWEILGVIGHLCLIDFILFRHLQLNGLEPEIGLGVCLCVGKVLGTPRHPFKKTVTSFLVFSFYLLSLGCWF
jgi:hypothetical protein